MNMSNNEQNIFSATKQGLINRIKQLNTELTKMTVIAATRLEAIRILGFIQNRDLKTIDISKINLDDPIANQMIINEFKGLVKHFRERANYFEKLVDEKMKLQNENREEKNNE